MIRVYTRRCAKVGQKASQKAQHDTAWALLWDVLQKEYGLLQSDLTLAYTQAGKPYFVHSPIHFNLSHTASIAVLAIGAQEVGVDAEPSSRKISDAVRTRYLQNCDRAVALTAWTVREAYGKMIGDGFFATSMSKPYYLETLFAYQHTITVCSTDPDIAREVLAF